MLDNSKYYRERREGTHTHTEDEDKKSFAVGGKICNSRYHP